MAIDHVIVKVRDVKSSLRRDLTAVRELRQWIDGLYPDCGHLYMIWRYHNLYVVRMPEQEDYVSLSLVWSEKFEIIVVNAKEK